MLLCFLNRIGLLTDKNSFGVHSEPEKRDQVLARKATGSSPVSPICARDEFIISSTPVTT
jgi:hypothetical protein